MPDKPKTQHRSARIEDDDWADLATDAAEMGADRTKVIVALVRWYLRRPGAKLPQRPPVRPRHGASTASASASST